MLVNARCTLGPTSSFTAIRIQRRTLGPRDVLIDIAYAGICHSDIDHARQLRGGTPTRYPLVPGHEIAGVVAAVGSDVSRFRVGDFVGVGNMVGACLDCRQCHAGMEQYCSGQRVLTYNSLDYDGQPTYGGYSEKIVVDEHFVIRIPVGMPLERAAPLFCAGITLYSPLRHWHAGPGKRIAIIGLGGLGHLGVQIARAMQAHTTVLELAPGKREDALRLGADDFRLTTDPATFRLLESTFDLIISTVPVNLDFDKVLALLAVDGTLVTLAASVEPLSLAAMSLLRNRRSIAGTLSGGLAETQEMIDFCALHGIGAEVEVIAADRIDEAYERLLAGEVRYRFVVDIGTLADIVP